MDSGNRPTGWGTTPFAMSSRWPCDGEAIPIIPEWSDQVEDPPGDFLDEHEAAEAATIFATDPPLDWIDEHYWAEQPLFRFRS